MNKDELIEKLESLAIKEYEYSLNGEFNSDSIVLYNNYNKWEIYYMDERGNRNLEHICYSEEEAYNYIYKLFLNSFNIKKKFGLN